LLAALAFAMLVPASRRPRGQFAPSFISSIQELPPRYWRYLLGVLAHGLGDFAPTLLIFRATQLLAPSYGGIRAAAIAIGLYTFHNLIDAAAAYPAGALGDKISKRALLAIGYSLAAIVAAGFIFAPPTIPALAALFGIAGIHLAIRDAIEKALAAELLPTESRGSGFGVLATVNGIGDLVSSVSVGILWSAVSPTAGFIYSGVLVLCGAFLILRSR